MLTKQGSDTLYHGSPRKLKRLSPRDEHGDPNFESSVFASPSKTFALAYTGRKWGDRDLEQVFTRSKSKGAQRMSLREMYPGALKSIYGGAKGYLYSVPPESFREMPGRRTYAEVLSTQAVTPSGVKVIPDALEALQNDKNVALIAYDLQAKETIAAVKRQAARAREMPDGGAGYLKWRLAKATPEMQELFTKEMGEEKRGMLTKQGQSISKYTDPADEAVLNYINSGEARPYGVKPKGAATLMAIPTLLGGSGGLLMHHRGGVYGGLAGAAVGAGIVGAGVLHNANRRRRAATYLAEGGNRELLRGRLSELEEQGYNVRSPGSLNKYLRGRLR